MMKRHMQLSLNHKPYTLKGQTISDLLNEIAMNRSYFAVSVNKTIIPRQKHKQHPLKEGDSVIIVQPVGGG